MRRLLPLLAVMVFYVFSASADAQTTFCASHPSHPKCAPPTPTATPTATPTPTPTATPAPGPTGFHKVSSTQASITTDWDPDPTGTRLRYEVTDPVDGSIDVSNGIGDPSGGSSAHQFSGLACATSYLLRARTVFSSGPTAWTDLTASTSPCPTPTPTPTETPTPTPTGTPTATPTATPTPPAGTPVSRRVGVNVHMNYGSTAYADVPLTKSRLDYLGLDLVRDTGQSGSTYGPKIAQLDADAIVYCGGQFNTWWGEFSEASCAQAADAAIPRLVAVEGANEPYTCSGETAGSDQQRLVNHMVRLRDAASLLGLETYSVSNCAGGGGTDWWSQPFIDGIVNNAHSYAAPGSYPTLAQLDNWIANTQFAAPGRYVATEMGAYTPYNNGELNGATWQLVDVLHHLYRGTERMAVYELQDSGSDASPFGFWSSAGVKRQAADAMHNLMGLVGSTVTGPLTTTVSVSDPAGTALSLTFTDGVNEYVALWNRSSTATRNVTLTLGEARPATAFRPVTAATGTDLGTASSFSISLGNEPVVVKVQ